MYFVNLCLIYFIFAFSDFKYNCDEEKEVKESKKKFCS